MEKFIKINSIIIENISVRKKLDSDAIKENALYITGILIPYSEDINKTERFPADLTIKEESFIRGFQQLNTITVEIIIRNNRGEIIKTILVTEETENTVSSNPYLFKILKKGFLKAIN